MWRSAAIILAIVGLFNLIICTQSCNEAVCGSIVSKCLLTQSCKCDYTNCTCCKECFNCLSFRFTECCSCVDMCPKSNDTASSLSEQSSIYDYHEKVPSLFKVLTENPDPEDRWLSFTYPVQYDPMHFSPSGKDYTLQLQSSDPAVKPLPTPNCTVAFMTDCMSQTKCRSNCLSMGATSVRWFHNGCCQCIGDACINYGLSESKCLKCSHADINTIEDGIYNEDEYVYSDDDDEDMD